MAGAAIVALGALVLSGCASQREDGGGEENTSDVDSTFVFGSSGDIAGLDPAMANDGETFRVSRQIFEGLVGVEAGTADPAPGLAESWEQSEDGLTYTFQLKEGVTFHDGTDFNAEAVCFNFDRMNNFTGLAATESLSYYWGKLMRGYAETGTSIYGGCEATSETEATITLTQPFAGFIPALSLPSFAIQSPAALEEFAADEVGGTAEAPVLSEYAQGHPVGTGPFKFDAWAPGESVTLSAYEDYWGEQGQVQEIIFQVIGDTTARRQALESGSIDGYDLVAPADIGALEEAGFNAGQPRPVQHPVPGDEPGRAGAGRHPGAPGDRPRDRQGAAGHAGAARGHRGGARVHAARRHRLERGRHDVRVRPRGGQGAARRGRLQREQPADAAVQLPRQRVAPVHAEPGADLHQPGVAARGRRHRAHPGGRGLEPHVPRPHPGRRRTTASTSSAGPATTTTPTTSSVRSSPAGNEWGFDNPELFAALTEARGLATEEEQEAAYLAVNEQIMEFMPGIPLAHPVPTLAFAERVTSYPASPVQDEVYNLIELSE